MINRGTARSNFPVVPLELCRIRYLYRVHVMHVKAHLLDCLTIRISLLRPVYICEAEIGFDKRKDATLLGYYKSTHKQS